MKKLNFSKNHLLTILIFLPLLTISKTAKVIILPLYDTSPNEPIQFKPDSIYNYYSKSNICTVIKFGKPGYDLQIIIEEQKYGFYIDNQGCTESIFSSDYSPKKSSTFYSDEIINTQYINDEMTKVLLAQEIIKLFQPQDEYFNSSTTLKERKNGKYQKSLFVSNFSFLYVPTSEEIQNIKDKKKNKKNDTKIPEKVIEEEENENSEYGDPYTPTYDEYGNLVFGDDKKKEDEFVNPFENSDESVFDNNNILSESSHLCGHLGLLSPASANSNYMNSLNKNFVKQLKEKKIVDGYYWYVRFNKDHSGEFVIGAAPHEIKPNNYFEDDLNTANAKYINDFYYWEISFSSIYYTNNKNEEIKSKTEKSGIISFNHNFIIADYEYYQNIRKDYFEEYINKTICKTYQVNESYSKFTEIYCDEKKFKESDMKKFPELILKSPSFNFEFKIDYKDVFMKTKNQVIFKILFTGKNEQTYWTLGKLFLTKYQFVFNHDSKTFGFYTTFIPETIEGDHEKGKYPSKNEKQENKLKPSNRKREEREKKIREYRSKTNWYKIIIIGLLIFALIMIGCYAIKRWNFRNKVDSKTIENYKKFRPRNKKSFLSDEDVNMEQI